MTKRIIVAWDLETTGRVDRSSEHWQRQPGIVQFGAVRLEECYTGDWLKIDELDLLVNPEIDAWEQGAIETHGITPEKVSDAPSLLVAHAQIAAFFTGATHSMGYNIVHFDYPVLDHQLRRYSLQHYMPWPAKDIDLMRYAPYWCDIAGKRGIKRPNLGELYQIVTGKPIEGAHDALQDVRACVEIFKMKIADISL